METNFIMELISKIIDLIKNILDTLGLDTSKVPTIDLEDDAEAEETV